MPTIRYSRYTLGIVDRGMSQYWKGNALSEITSNTNHTRFLVNNSLADVHKVLAFSKPQLTNSQCQTLHVFCGAQ